MLNTAAAAVALSATWYAKGLKNPEHFTAASWLWPRYSTQCFVRPAGPRRPPRHVRVLVNDVPADRSVQLDLSRGAFRQLAPLSVGRITVYHCDGNHSR